MQTFKVTVHTDDGEPATVLYLDATDSAHALRQAAGVAIRHGLSPKTVEVDE